MKAVILAGGEGTRLRPLTCNLPNPLVPICGKPVLFYILDLLAENGCTDAVIAVHYKGNMIENAIQNGRYKNINITFSHEKTPLGTAGCVKQAADDFTDDFIVISGDAMCDFDLKKAMEFHKNSGNEATIITKSVDDPREYGLILGENNKVTGFCEKPSYVNCRSEQANTGIYILSPAVIGLIPGNEMWDFAKNVFPDMLGKKIPLGYYEESGYWCDIGDIGAYKRCNGDVLSGSVRCRPPRNNAKITPVRRLSPNAFIGNGSKISSSAFINGTAVIGENVSIGHNAKLNGAIVMDGAYIGEEVTLNDCIICKGAKIGSGAAVYENAVVGEGSAIGENAVICSGVKIWQNKEIPDGAYVGNDVKYGTKNPVDITENGIVGETNAVITPEFAGRLGCALSKITDGFIAVSSCGEPSSEALKNALLSGISSTGKKCYDCEETSLPVLSYTARLLGCDITVHISSKNRTKLLIHNKGLLSLTRQQERLLENALNRGEYLTADWSSFGSINRFSGALPLYTAMLDSITDFTIPYNVTISGGEATGLLAPYLKRIGSGREKLMIKLSSDGKKAEIISADTTLDYTSLLLIASARLLSKGKDVALPFEFPRTADFIAHSYGRNILRFYASSMDNSDRKARRLAERQTFLQDGFVLAMNVLAYMSENGLSLKELTDSLPRSANLTRFIRITCPPQKILNRLSAEPAENEGAVIANDNERVFIRSNKKGTGFYLFAESFDSETAAALCDRTEKLINSVNTELTDKPSVSKD